MSRKKKNRKPTDCSGCEYCLYIGEGDFVCDKHIHQPDKALVIADWVPTDNHLQCIQGGKINNENKI